MSATIYVTLPNSSAYRAYPRNNPGKTSFQIDEFLTGLSQMIGPLNGSPKPFVWSFPNRQVILIGAAFHGICPPIFIQTWLQPHCRCTLFHSAYCSPSNPICFRSVGCRRTMIPGKIFTSCAKFQGIVRVNDFRLPIRLQELSQPPLCFLRSFCFARIRLDPLGGQVLHHDYISMILSRFTSFTENFVICCNQMTKKICTPMRLLHGALVIFVLWQISQFRSFGKWVQTLCSPKSALLAAVGSKDGSWEELACESLYSGTFFSCNMFFMMSQQ